MPGLAEALPEHARFASGFSSDSIQDSLSSGRVATVRRWVALARGMHLADPVVDLAEAEVALLAGEYERAMADGSHAAGNATSRDLRLASRACSGTRRPPCRSPYGRKALVQVRGSFSGFPQARAAALWGQLVVHSDDESGELEEALHRFAAASDGTGEHEMRLAHGRMLVELAKGDARRALDHAEEAAALVPLSSDSFANLAALNQVAGMLAIAARYDESLHAAERLIAAVEGSGIDFALSHALLAKARALIGLRRFADAHNALDRVMARPQLGVDPWTALYLPISQARLQVSLGRLDRARDHLTLEPDSRATAGLHGEYDAHRALIEAANGNDSEAAQWISRSRRSTSIDAQSLAWMAQAIRSVNCGEQGDQLICGESIVSSRAGISTLW